MFKIPTVHWSQFHFFDALQDCGHGWTSMKGRVAFWFVLNPTTGEGLVCLKLYGQQCDRCKTGNYEPAMWYPEEVLKVKELYYILLRYIDIVVSSIKQGGFEHLMCILRFHKRKIISIPQKVPKMIGYF